MKYAIVDTFNGDIRISGIFDNLDSAKESCYQLRKKRYAKGNIAMERLYDELKHDNFYNVVAFNPKHLF